MDWIVFGVQWLHVLLGIFWFGSTLYLDFVLIPALMTLPLGEQRRAGAAIGARAVPIFTGVAVAVIVLGILRGTVFGQIKSLDALGTQYGVTWLVAGFRPACAAPLPFRTVATSTPLDTGRWKSRAMLGVSVLPSMPRNACSTFPCLINSATTSLTVLIGIAKPMPTFPSLTPPVSI